MPLPNIFTKEVSNNIIDRINNLSADDKGTWGSMSASQMLAHCNVTYEMVYEDIHPKPKFPMSFILKAFVKKIVTNETPFKKNERTAPQFLVKNDKDFIKERDRLVKHIKQTQELGETHFDNKMSHSLGKLNKAEWNNMFYKHLDHHLKQFGK